LIAGFILSSFPHERIRRSHHRSIKIIDNTPEARTNNEIASKTNSQKSSCCPSIVSEESKA